MDPRGPNVLRNTLSGSTAVGRLATADAARRRSFFSSVMADDALRLGPYMSVSR